MGKFLGEYDEVWVDDMEKYEIHKMPRIFIDFLDSRGILDLFISNFEMQHDIIFCDYMIYRKALFCNFIDYAFYWDRTLEGHEFWRDIQNDWNNMLRGRVEEFCNVLFK